MNKGAKAFKGYGHIDINHNSQRLKFLQTQLYLHNQSSKSRSQNHHPQSRSVRAFLTHISPRLNSRTHWPLIVAAANNNLHFLRHSNHDIDATYSWLSASHCHPPIEPTNIKHGSGSAGHQKAQGTSNSSPIICNKTSATSNSSILSPSTSKHVGNKKTSMGRRWYHHKGSQPYSR